MKEIIICILIVVVVIISGISTQKYLESSSNSLANKINELEYGLKNDKNKYRVRGQG